MIKRRLRPGYLYIVTSVHETTLDDYLSCQARVVAQFPDAHLPGKMLAASVIMQSGTFNGSAAFIQGTFRLHNLNPQTTCMCRAYEWPHRLGSGKCWGLEHGNIFCGSCGRPTREAKMGPSIVSQCCAAQLFNDPELEEPL